MATRKPYLSDVSDQEWVEVGGQTVAASEDDPRYLVQSEKTGEEAAHKPDAIDKV